MLLLKNDPYVILKFSPVEILIISTVVLDCATGKVILIWFVRTINQCA